jgi:hypothetical protein
MRCVVSQSDPRLLFLGANRWGLQSRQYKFQCDCELLCQNLPTVPELAKSRFVSNSLSDRLAAFINQGA